MIGPKEAQVQALRLARAKRQRPAPAFAGSAETTQQTQETTTMTKKTKTATKSKTAKKKPAAKKTVAKAKPAAAADGKPTKKATIITQLQSAEGATMEAMTKATNWTAHSVHGLLGALRKGGMKIESKQECDHTVYRAAA